MGRDEDGRSGDDRGEPRLREHLRYRFDNLLARGTSATLVWLGAVTVAAVLLSTLLLALAGVAFAGSENDGWVEDAWQSLLRVIDPGTMVADVGWGRRLLALLVTIFGLLIAGTLIGIIAAGVEDRIDRMRRGRSVVIESDHLVVLGASDRLPVLLRQLVLAGAEGGSRTIVVLADRDPAEIREAARGAQVGGSGVRIVSRCGDPTTPDDLALARLATARAAIVLSDQRSDGMAVETVLAIAAELGGLDDLTVVVELVDEDTARRLHRAYGPSIHPIVTTEAIARTTAFALRQRGLGKVLGELLDFRGPDVHLLDRPESAVTSFGQLVGAMTNARPIGLLLADGQVALCPPFATPVGSEDRIIVISESGEDVDHPPRSAGSPDATTEPAPTPSTSEERVVVLGWNDLAARILQGWASSAAPSSTLEIIIEPEQVDTASVLVPDLGPIPVTVTGEHDSLTAAAARQPTTIVFLAPKGDPADADVGTILDVRALQREYRERGGPTPRFVVELLDAVHESLIDLDGPDDLVISDAMGSQFIAQLVDQPARREILLALYSTEQASMDLIACGRYGLDGDYLVRELVDRVATYEQVVIGWRRSGSEVRLNPHLTARVQLGPDDELVVISRRSTVA